MPPEQLRRINNCDLRSEINYVDGEDRRHHRIEPGNILPTSHVEIAKNRMIFNLTSRYSDRIPEYVESHQQANDHSNKSIHRSAFTSSAGELPRDGNIFFFFTELVRALVRID